MFYSHKPKTKQQKTKNENKNIFFFLAKGLKNVADEIK